jgi:type I restriction enzyme, S subunit
MVPATARILSRARLSVGDFVACFPVLVEAAGSAKQLRELLLSLAVRGLLTQRLPADDRVDALLEDLGRTRARASAGTFSRSEHRVTAAPVDEAPFVVPETWRWVKLGELGSFVGGGTPSKANAAFWKGPIPWVSPKDMKRPYIDDAADHISAAAVEGSAAKLVPPRSLLFVVRGMNPFRLLPSRNASSREWTSSWRSSTSLKPSSFASGMSGRGSPRRR